MFVLHLRRTAKTGDYLFRNTTNNTMKYRFILPAAGLIAAPVILLAQQAPAPAPAAAPAEPAGEIDIEARRQSIVEIEEHIADRVQRMNELAEDITRLDERVEARIDKIVGKLKTMADSGESQVRVAQTKEEAIGGLRKTIDYYVRKRDDLAEALRTGRTGLSRDDVTSDKLVFDNRIDKRIGQIIGLSRSFTEHKELKKYTESHHSSGWGWNWSNTKISDEWRHNRKSVRRSESQKRELETALQSSIDRLSRREADLRETLRVGKLTDRYREILESDLDSVQTQISTRKNQIAELWSSGGEGNNKVSRNEAHRVQLAIRDEADDLRSDFFLIFEKYAKLNLQRENVEGVRKNLEARKKWMAEWEAENGSK